MRVRPLYLDGQWTTTNKSVEVRNPATAEIIASVSTVDRAAVATAIASAHRAFLSWRTQTAKARREYLQHIAAHLDARAEEIARTLTLENGKPIAQSRAEVSMSIEHLRWFAEEAGRAYGRIVPNQASGKRHLVVKTPIGVVGAISPWNFPLMLAVRKIAPALAAGCTVILKPARQTPLCALAFAECAAKAQLPAGVFQVVVGPAADIGQEFLENPLCRKVSFTGSTDVGRELIRGAAPGVKPLSLELGGQAPVLIFADADLDRALEGTMVAKFRNTGQSCIAANRIYVERPVYATFAERFVQRVKAMRVGNGLDPDIEIGPLIDEAALDGALEHIQDAQAKGAQLLCGGSRKPSGTGHFLEPTVLGEVPDQALCMREETFAPVAPLAPFDTEREAIDKANSTPFGLSAYVFTSDLSRCFRIMDELEAGIIAINDGLPTTSQAPFGGLKQSGWGRELGLEGMEAFLETKHISIGI
jgi:succinate-semialdehyde dehydrogenase / glutarate-semialdehyde dehydrogenase